ncbi:hypothetical protein [Limosilactobacillus oris]|uniref:hypothetical protein n=1 Tax=Limosilactobacillus oris TaxID=1632 RepID=UPI0022357951|nr:hypothetical protein [Limosilactobacillus oris]MCW4388751.1 hypothetical protein [Limosilactobacillus oris]
MTDKEQRAHDLALQAVNAVLILGGNPTDDYDRLKNHQSNENIFSVYANFYREFLYRLDHEQL